MFCLVYVSHRLPGRKDFLYTVSMAITTFEDLKKRFDTLKALNERKVIAGWLDSNGTARKAKQNLDYRKKTGKRTAALREPPSNALIARTLNYGRKAGTTLEGVHYSAIPARPFLRFAMERYRALMPKIEQKYIPLVITGKFDVDALCLELGVRLKDCITLAMRDSARYEALHEATLIARRREKNDSPTPLIDTHQLIDSVTFEVK